ncbi:primosomal protein N' (replication factor Y) - superfamily II helicase, partial [Rhodovulum sulfidophilum]|nr:primosomal protein N' (replication factor Y) - superfamily II helicase [Rhodovulum sulfidophilum]
SKFDIGGDRQRVDWLETRISTLTFKHVLLPVWLAAYRYRGKTYRFVVNGRNGRVQGERPWSAWKIAFAVGLVLAVVGGLAAGIGYLSALQQ